MGADANRDPALVLLATAQGCWQLDEDAALLTPALEATGVSCAPAVWNDPDVRWDEAELVVVRSTWDYAPRRGEYLRWADAVQAVTTLANPAEVIAWNTDKAYLGQLAQAGFAVVPTEFVPPAQVRRMQEVLGTAAERGEFVLKPSVSAGSKDTGRFLPGDMDRALRLADSIAGSGRTLMVQPYLGSVDEEGETGLVYFEGDFSHAFNKGPMLTAGADPEPGPYAPERIVASSAAPPQLELAGDLLDFTASRFATTPLHARVDLVTGVDGEPVVMELELTEPSWFLATDPESPARAAAAIATRLRR